MTRLEVEKSPQQLRIRLPRHFGPARAVAVAVALLLEGMAGYSLATHPAPYAWFFACLPLLVLGAVLVGVLRREEIVAVQEGLTVGGHSYSWDEVEDLRLVPRVADLVQQLEQATRMANAVGMKLPPGTDRSLAMARRYSGRLGPGTLQFRQGKATRRFGFGLSDAEAQEALDLLKPWAPALPMDPLGGLGSLLQMLPGAGRLG